MIDLAAEHVLTLSQAAKHVPKRRGKHAHSSTIYRWATGGCRGVKLEAVRIGGTICTSVEAVQRFIDRLTAGDKGLQQSAQPYICPHQIRTRERQIAAAEQHLDAAGV
jgi:hypothetical protein